MTLNPFKAIYAWGVHFLMKSGPATKTIKLTDFKRLSYEIRPGDVILVAGRSRVSEVIKIVTQSHWSHAALYIGRLHDIESVAHRKVIENHFPCAPNDQLIIESEIGKGTVVTLLSNYQHDHLRICRPKGLRQDDANAVINYCVENLGKEYNVRQIFDLARFMFPWHWLPRRWRSSLFKHNAGKVTKEVCSTLIAKAFTSVDFPILPHIKMEEKGKNFELLHRNPRLYTPSDFDFSPYFDIVKYPLFGIDGSGLYHHLPWNKDKVYHDTPEEVSAVEKKL